MQNGKVRRRLFYSLSLVFVILSFSSLLNSQEKIYDNGRYFVGELEKSFTVQPGGKLYVNTQSGDIDISTGSDTEIHIRVIKKIDVYSEDEAREAFKRTPVQFEQRGNDIYAETENYYRRRRSSVRTNFEVTIPKKYNIDIRTSSGDIRFTSLDGNCDIQTSSGDLEGLDVGGYLNARTSSGDIDFGNVSGDVYARTSSGDVEVGGVIGRAELETSSGDITVGNISTYADLRTSSGDIRIRSTGKDLKAHTSSGDITVDSSGGYIRLETSSGDIKAYSVNGSATVTASSGDIELEDVKGAIDARTSSGRIYAMMSLLDTNADRSCRLTSGSGEVTLGLPSNINASIDATIRITRNGWDDYTIYSDFPIKIQDKRDYEDYNRRSRRERRYREVIGTGEINGGGNIITIRTTNSDIIIRKIN